MLSDIPAAIATSRAPSDVWRPVTINGGKRECISLGRLSSFNFHRIFRSLTFSFVRIRSSRCQFVRWGSPPFVGQSAPRPAEEQRKKIKKQPRVWVFLIVQLTDSAVQVCQNSKRRYPGQ